MLPIVVKLLQMAPKRKQRAIKVMDGFAMRFQKNRKDGKQLFYCLERERTAQCIASALYDPVVDSFEMIFPHERHEKDVFKADSYVARRELKESANSGMPREIIDKVRDKYDPIVSLMVGSYEAKRKIIYNARAKPDKDTNTMNGGGPVAQSFSTDLDGRRFLLADEIRGQSRILIFCSDEGLNLLANSNILMADGTFDIAPKGFTQLFTLHAQIAPNVVRPAAYCFLNDKKAETYKRCIEIIKNEPNMNNWNPAIIICDFEAAIRKSFLDCFPGTSFEGCLFHLSQSWRREAEKLKIYDEFVHGTILDFWCRLRAIPFIESQSTSAFFTDLIATLPLVRSPELNAYVSYLENNYMSPTARYSSEMWSVYDRTKFQIHRTTNVLECWNRVVSKVVSAKHGYSNVLMSDAIQAIRVEERHTTRDAAELRINPNHSVNKRRKSSNIAKDRRLLVCLQNNPVPPNVPLTGVQYLDAISFASKI